MLRSAKTTKDMLEIQENIRELEDEIDVAEGRLRFIDDRVNYSTLNLMLYKEKVRSSATSKSVLEIDLEILSLKAGTVLQHFS
ncbi:DUF4349 domain-containing protein [Chryseobacterium indoltheticum]|uniref:DUF4349 domain-containing protein n=1 Tax=Chryseobacterium indoltheticum TaxID=254 RepID=UPI003F4983F7